MFFKLSYLKARSFSSVSLTQEGRSAGLYVFSVYIFLVENIAGIQKIIKLNNSKYINYLW